MGPEYGPPGTFFKGFGSMGPKGCIGYKGPFLRDHVATLRILELFGQKGFRV